MSSSAYNPRDAFYRKAKQAHLRARSAFKIDEIQQRFRLVRPGDAVVDLGAAPGGFLQVLAEQVGPKGRVVGIDLVPIKPLGGVVVETAAVDVMEPGLEAQLRRMLARPSADVVASDMAPKTSGIRDADEARSLLLVDRALDLALTLLHPGGHFVAKVFMGGDFDVFFSRVKGAFEDARVVRPEATRSRSREVYIVGQRRRPAKQVSTGV
jgi:23S rRNA (uridine2552-2'-O)-methyltransferase